jgi:SAM-dependent methyltransferase
MRPPVYDRIGLDYSEVRRADPRIAAAISAALGDAESVLNAGAGAGSYEPCDRAVTAVEPSAAMIAQRPAGAAPVVQGTAEDLPFDEDDFDAAMAVLTIHHWADLRAGLAELRRVARRRIVLLTIEAEVLRDLWLTSDYFPAIYRVDAARMPSLEHLARLLPGAQASIVPVPRDCQDGFGLALWGRPEAVLDPVVRRGSSVWHELAPAELQEGADRLRADLEDGTWEKRYGSLREERELDVGLRLVCAELR